MVKPAVAMRVLTDKPPGYIEVDIIGGNDATSYRLTS